MGVKIECSLKRSVLNIKRISLALYLVTNRSDEIIQSATCNYGFYYSSDIKLSGVRIGVFDSADIAVVNVCFQNAIALSTPTPPPHPTNTQ